MPTGASDQLPGEVRCCIAGCGPAGAILGLLLARAGISVLSSKNMATSCATFAATRFTPRLSRFWMKWAWPTASCGYRTAKSRISVDLLRSGDKIDLTLARLKTKFRFVAFVPQWDFFNFIIGEASRYPDFRLALNAEVTDLMKVGDFIARQRHTSALSTERVTRYGLF